MKFRLSDADPRHLSARPFIILLIGFALFFISGWFAVMGLGGWVAWFGVVLGLALVVIGGAAAVREKRDQQLAADDQEHA